MMYLISVVTGPRQKKRLILSSILFLCGYSFLWILISSQQLYTYDASRSTDGGVPRKSFWNEASQEEAFSACLLVMDDSHYLTEWLAYHYHTANLRTLILVMDPQSQTSPQPVLDRWKSLMEITVWTDQDFATSSEFEEALQKVQAYFGGSQITPNLARHRARQRLFYYKCLKELKHRGKHWTLLTDTDEFVAVNYQVARDYNVTQSLQTPDQAGAVSHFVHEHASHVLPVEQLAQNPPLFLLQSSPCIQIPRIRFGASESVQENVQRGVPSGYNGSDFLTLRYRTHTAENEYKLNKISKTLLDLSRISDDELVPVDSIHLPVRAHCQQRRLHLRKPQSLLVIHHYLGSWEQYAYREKDARAGKERSQSQWQAHNLMTHTQTDDDEVRPWLAGFDWQRSNSAAQALLQGVGQLQPKSWTTYMGNPKQDRCALCFFGLPRSFSSMVLPSIIQNLLIPNARHNCDVYVHFYEQYQEGSGRKNRGGTIDPHQIYLLEQAVRKVQAQYGPPRDARTHRTPTVFFTYDTEEQFWERRRTVVEKFQNSRREDGSPKYFPYDARSYEKSSIDNIVKQWHSIQMSFKLMEVQAKQQGFQYSRVGMFRSDVMYMTPIDVAVMDMGVTDSSNQQVVVPGFAQMPVNDRMVYGPYEAVKVWATKRFDLIEERANHPEIDGGYVLHSERFLNVSVFPAMEAAGYPISINKDICFIRARADESAMISDCGMSGTARGWDSVDKKERVERIVGKKCTRFKMGPKWIFVGCGEGIYNKNGV